MAFNGMERGLKLFNGSLIIRRPLLMSSEWSELAAFEAERPGTRRVVAQLVVARDEQCSRLSRRGK